jgi:ubiquinone/menaquinone biosynthesis C-methylase UbiE
VSVGTTNRASRGQDAVVREYSATASEYDKRWSKYIDATVRETLVRFDATNARRVLDIGCGTGVLLGRLRAVPPHAALIGVDLAGPMLRIARPRLANAAALWQAAAGELPLRDASVDRVVSSNVFHYFREPQRALAEMYRVLEPAGKLVLTDWCDDYLACRMCDRILRVVNRAHFKTYRAAELHAMAHAAGFSSIKVEHYKIDWLWGLMTLTASRS